MTFDELYAAHADSVYSFLRYKIRDIHLVEDIFQDTFLAVYQEMNRGRLPTHPKSWLLTIAHRRMVDRLRRVPTQEVILLMGEALEQRENMDFAQRLFFHEQLDRLEEACRTILYALYVEGMTIRETAQMLGIPEGTVKSRSHTAKLKLSQWMKEDEQADESKP